MFQFPHVHDHFGRAYRVYHPSQGPLPKVARAERFSSPFYAQQFLVGLDAGDEFWVAILKEYGEDHAPVGQPLTVTVAQWLATGRMRIYRVPSLKQMAKLGSLTRFAKNENTCWQLLPPASLEGEPKPIHSFADLEEARRFLLAQNLSAEQLKAMKQLSGGQYWNSAEPVTSIAREIQASNLVVVEQPIASAPPASSNSATEEEDDADPGPGHRPVTHVPMENSEVSAETKEHPEEKPVCELERMTLKCSHFNERNFLLDVLNIEPNHNGVEKVIQVLSQDDREADEINVAFGGKCHKGNAECPAVTIEGDGIKETVTKSPYKLRVIPPDRRKEVKTFKDFLKYALIPKMDGDIYNTYHIQSKGCKGIEECDAQVHVFPTWKWDGSVKMGYCYKGDFDNNKAKSDERAKWSLEAKLNGNCATKHWTLETSNGEETDNYFPSLYNTLRDIADRIDDMILAKKEKDPSPIEVNITWPKIELSGGVELQEVESRYEVDPGGHVTLSMAPLLQADMKLDIVHWLIKTTPPGYQQFLKDIRKRAAKGIGTKNAKAKAVIALDLTLTGGLGGDLSWTKEAQKPWCGKATGKASLTVKLKAEISAEAKVFYVKIKIGIRATLASDNSEAEGLGGTFNLKAVVAQGKPALDGYIEFTGAAIYYTYYAELGGSEVDSDKQGTEKPKQRSRSGIVQADPEPSGEDAGSSYKEEKTRRVPIFKAARFPNEPRRYTLDEIEF